jgi:hypothetical protein
MESVTTEVVEHVARVIGLLQFFVVVVRVSYAPQQCEGPPKAFVLVGPSLTEHRSKASTARQTVQQPPGGQGCRLSQQGLIGRTEELK